jgi:tetratricopeptide (TPR) repeat protein
MLGKPLVRIAWILAGGLAAWGVIAACTQGGVGQPPELVGVQSSSAEDDAFVEEFRRAQQLFGGGKDDRAEAIFRKLLEKHPDAAAVHHALGWIDWFRGRHDVALRSFEEAARYAPGDGAIRRDLGFRLIDLGREVDALPHLEAARQLLDPDCETLCGISRGLTVLGRADETERTLREAHKVDPHSIDARTLLARQVVRRDPAEAAALLQDVPPNWPDVVLVRAQAMERLARWDEAVAASSRAAELAAPGLAGVPTIREAAESLLRAGGGPRAAEVAQSWVDRETAAGAPTPRAMLCLAVAKASSGDAAAALAAIGGVKSESDPGPPPAPLVRLLRAHLLLEIGRPDDARATLSSVADADPQDAAFERAFARRVVWDLSEADLAALAAKDPARANDVAWAEWMRARFAGDAEGATAAQTAILGKSNPPGELPAALFRTAR